MTPDFQEMDYNVIASLHNSAPTGRVAVLFALVLLSLITGFSQIKTEGLAWQEANYLPRLEAAANHTAPAPWQYRVLTDRLVLAVCHLAVDLGLPRPIGLTFVTLRLLQNLALFGLAFVFYRRLGIGAFLAILGLSAVAWGMTQANYGSTLAFAAYTDLLLYLAAALALLEGRYRWIVPITLVAALNRETSGLIPVMALAYAYARKREGHAGRDVARPAALALGLYFLIFAGLRLGYGVRPWVGDETGADPTFGFLLHNLTNDTAWGHAAGVLGIIPILALLTYRMWHPLLRPVFWSVAPAWILIHLLLVPLGESRALLLPQLLIFIPGLLCGIQHLREHPTHDPDGLLV